jgi:uncharacterized protein involved in type VI secretion and phage assembly
VVSTSLLELLSLPPGCGTEERITGVVLGIVTNNDDQDGLGRVKVRFPWLSNGTESHWARVAAPMAGRDRGLYFLPEVDDEVLVLFERGDVRFPFVIGALWNGKDMAPADNADGKNAVRIIKSRSGHLIRFDDSEAAPKLEIIDAQGKNRIIVDTGRDSVIITAAKDIVLEAPQGDIRMQSKNFTLEAAGEVRLSAEQMALSAKRKLDVHGNPIDLNC